jgi:DNA-binding NarL/FixJ family response regulator
LSIDARCRRLQNSRRNAEARREDSMKQELGLVTGVPPAAMDIERYVREALQRALSETFARIAAPENVEGLLRQLVEGGASPAVAHRPESKAQLAALTAREQEILRCIAAGHSNKAIARTYGLSVHTVKRHVANILGKIGVSSRVQAAMWMAAHH